LVIPEANAAEAGLVPEARVRTARHLTEVIAHLRGSAALPRLEPTQRAVAAVETPDLSDVRGQGAAKRALTIAAAGSHNLLMIGPPGSGKSMLAERVLGLLPSLPPGELLRVASIASVAGKPVEPLLSSRPPFRAPHHTTSPQALVGGGPRPRPGEISLAHRGILFLDELPEFSRAALEALREPLQTGTVRISRVREQVSFPADFQLLAAMNPCPCGYLGDGTDRCRCSPAQLGHYRHRVSGPVLDRFDMHVEVPQVDFDVLTEAPPPAASSRLAALVAEARGRQLSRYGALNARVADARFWAALQLGGGVRDLLQSAVKKWTLSARSTVRVLKLARTIADLGASDTITEAHLAEALQLRCLDRTA
jgi:magnesium chelatase family protein